MSLINVEKTITLDVYDHDTTPSVIKTIQLDTGTRTVYAVIQNSRQDYDIGQNASVSLTVLRPDKTKVQITGETFVSYTGADGNTYGAKAELSDVALAVKGNLKAQFKITSGEQELRTEIFAINNGEALDAGDGDWAGDLDGHNLDEMAQDIEDTKTAVTEMESDISELKSGLSDVDIAMRKVPSMASGDGDADLYVSDDSGNALAKFLDGGFQVKKFKGFDFITFQSESKVYTGTELSFVITRHFSKGDRIVLHMERGAMPWEYGAYVTYTAGQTVVVDNWRGDCAWLEYTLTEDVDKITAVYPANSNFVPRSTNITFEVSLLGDVPIRPTVVTVKQDGTGDFTTLRGALDYIGTKANDVLNPYRIEIYPGTYDVLADYTDEEIESAAYTQTDFVGPKLLNGMYLIGMGAFPEETVLTASLDPDKWSNTIRGAISTLNCQGTGGFENLTIEAHNIRYCVHDDYHTPLKKKPKRLVKNCIFRGYNISYTPGHTYGASTTSSGCDFEFINCDFGEIALVHTLPTMQFRPYIHFTNCTGSGFMIGDYETTSVEATGRYVCRLDGCGFPWIKNSLDSDGAVSHALICGSGSRSPLYQLPVGTPYLTDDVTVVPNVLLQFTGGVGTVVERYSDTGHGPRFRLATSAKTADGVVVYQDDNNTYIQTRGYVKTDRTNLTQFVLGDYVGLSDGSMVVVSDPADAFAQIRYIDASGYGYLMLKGV